MPHGLEAPIIYLITSGETTAATTPASKEFFRILRLTEAAVAANIKLVQLREKNLSARVLYSLTERSAAITRGSQTRLLVNDRADVACAAGANGVHLTSQSLKPEVVRKAFGDRILIGASTHSSAEARQALDSGADFVVFGPVFETTSKRRYGPPVGPEALRKVADELAPFPVLAIGGINQDNLATAFAAGAQGVAAIGLLNHPEQLAEVAEVIRIAYAHRMK